VPIVEDEGAEVVPGVLGLAELGFTPLQCFPMTWSLAWREWPAEHRASVPETRESCWAPSPPRNGLGPQLWLVRSPWPEVSLEQVFRTAHRLVTVYDDWETEPDRAATVLRTLLSWQPDRLLAACPPSDWLDDDEDDE
jgi:hypothetical protein